jgi:hypothetical protein
MSSQATIGCVFACCTVGLAAVALAADLPPFVYSHPPQDIKVVFPIAVKNSQHFAIQITNTCPEQFTYQIYAKTKPETTEAKAGIVRGGVERPQLRSVTVDSVYYDQFGAYELLIREREKPAYCDGAPAGTLKSVTLTITFETPRWEIGGDAALTFAPGTVNEWTVDDPTTKLVVRDSQHEAVGRFNFATLTHLYPPAWKGFGPVLGFGLVDNEVEYYFGAGLGLGPADKRHLNLATGVVFTTRSVLPAGVTEGKPVADPKVLESPSTQRAFRYFVAVTATFFRSSGGETKPNAPPPASGN